jgi:hypothetical protein
MKKIIVTSKGVVGECDKIDGFFNLSSAPYKHVVMIIRSMPQDHNDIALPLMNNMNYNTKTNTFMKGHGRKRRVMVVIDEDDNNSDIKIRNIMQQTKVDIIAKMIYKREKSKIKDQESEGATMRYMNHHHRKHVVDSLSSKIIHLTKDDNLVRAQLIKTNDDHAGSIAGLTVYMNVRSIPFIINQATVRYDEGWATSKKLVRRVRIDKKCRLKDTNPEGDKQWKFKTGYDKIIESDIGPVEIYFEKNEGKHSIMMKRIMSIFKSIGKSVINILIRIVNIFREICKNLFGTSNKKEKRRKGNILNNRLRENKRNIDSKIAWTQTTVTAINVVNMVSLTFSITTPKNASGEIKKANKLLANMQINKMLSKVGPTGDKTTLNMRQTDSTNAYIVGATSYNITDSTTVANNIAAKQNWQRRYANLVISSSLTATYWAIQQNYLAVVAIISMMIITYFAPSLQPEWVISLNLIMTSFNVRSLIVNMMIAIIELVVKPPTRVSRVRSLIYIVAQLLCL